MLHKYNNHRKCWMIFFRAFIYTLRFLKPYGISLRQKIKAWIFLSFSFIKGKGLCRYEAVGIKRSR